MKYFLFLLFTSFSLTATLNQPLRCEITSGYRNDRIHYHLTTPGDEAMELFSGLYRDIEYWENGLNLKVIHRDLYFTLNGAYGTFGEGTLFQRIPNQDQTRLSTNGWTADGEARFGYAVNLTADRTYKVAIIPLIGYSAHFERLNPRNMRLSWYGFLFGASFLVETNGRAAFSGGYDYNLLHSSFKSQIENDNLVAVKDKSSGDKGHTGFLQMDYILNHLWRIGIGGKIHYFFTRVVDSTLKMPSHTPEKFKMRWTAISGWAQISREF